MTTCARDILRKIQNILLLMNKHVEDKNIQITLKCYDCLQNISFSVYCAIVYEISCSCLKTHLGIDYMFMFRSFRNKILNFNNILDFGYKLM